ncbi:hypothetical protein SD960_02335 [Flavobacterium sp. MMLR14_040]|uniref:hypothetical protein n=1 Tax=Flavobacterium sp. MMLR14_040 TaxID=3093843 RepID=UPI0029905BF3|nr:hypothetical protein [Flavobacterium sp. MMLR14_040]MDW8848916.1 hypothetical protein [Flavobacterium sp. MMLR14_040]
MTYITNNNFEVETHPWQPFIPKKADKLLLGTFPTHPRNRKTYEFFYPNPNNDFWKIIFEIAGLNIENSQKKDPVRLRKKVLTQLGLGIADICHMIYRQKTSSNDNALFPIEFTDIFLLLENHPIITTIVVTSSSKNSSTLAWLHQYCSLNGNPFIIPTGKLPKTATLHFNNKIINIEIIPSTSRQSRIKGDERLEMYKNALLKSN